MVKKFEEFINENISNPEDEIFSAYNGRYLFNITKAYSLIDSDSIKSEIKKFPNYLLRQYSHPEFSMVDPEKMERIKGEIDYERPLGLLVKFRNPEDPSSPAEWVLADGNHRVRIAAEAGESGNLIVIDNPDETEKFMTVDLNIPHELFPDY